jgi:hypothetical protein
VPRVPVLRNPCCSAVISTGLRGAQTCGTRQVGAHRSFWCHTSRHDETCAASLFMTEDRKNAF